MYQQKKWIKDLNKKGYVGYHDWCLPMVEDAMSWMEPKKYKKDLHVDDVFDDNQFAIWTSDQTPHRELTETLLSGVLNSSKVVAIEISMAHSTTMCVRFVLGNYLLNNLIF